MTNVMTFGQRIAAIWRDLAEHLNEITAREGVPFHPDDETGREEGLLE